MPAREPMKPVSPHVVVGLSCQFNSQSGLSEPGRTAAGLSEGGLGEPGLSKSGLGEPGLGEPGLGESGLGESGLGESGLGESGLGKPGLGEPGPSESRLSELVRKHFSPLLPPEPIRALPFVNSIVDPTQILIQVVEAAFTDTGRSDICHNTAVFLSVNESWAARPELSRNLSDYFRNSSGADLTIMVATDTEGCVAEALVWLDRGECEFALVVACDFSGPNAGAAAAAVLIANANSALRDHVRIYASIENSATGVDADSAGAASSGSHSFDSSGIALLEVSRRNWLESAESSRAWHSMREADRAKHSSVPASGAAEANRAKPNANKNAIWTNHDVVGYASSLSLEVSADYARLTPLFAVINSALALYLRIIPGASKKTLQLDKSAKLVQCKNARPWIHPVSPVEPTHPRRCLALLEQSQYLLSEIGDDTSNTALRNLRDQSSELFVYAGATVDELYNNLAKHAAELLHATNIPLAAIAFKQNCDHQSHAACKLALVASNQQELNELIQQSLIHLESNPESALTQIGVRSADNSASMSPRPLPLQATGIYYTGRPAQKAGDIVFVFPGLGAAYPQMLADLCFYFPEVRQVFDFVERMALRAGDKIIPSRAIFPTDAGSQSSSQAMLATMDSSVVTLLLAEWAIYALLKRLGVNADVLLGCSTGEFAALTISDAVNIFESAQIFYTLSTHVSRSISLSQLSELKSLRVAASFEKQLKPLLAGLAEPVYVGADLSETCVLLSGQKAAIEALSKQLRQEKIDYLTLPVAIPYHTPLVSGKISEADVQLLEMRAPKVEAWSCSTESPYPDDATSLRKISTDLFEKPIRLRSTILKLYDANARVFVEVGPKGGLVPFISEVLEGREHLAIAANVATKSGIDQLNALLAVLVCHGVEMDLNALYQRRVAPSSHGSPDSFTPSNFPNSSNPLNPSNLSNPSDSLDSRSNSQRASESFLDDPYKFGPSQEQLGLRRSPDFENESVAPEDSFEELAGLYSQGIANTEEVLNNLLSAGMDLFSDAGLSDEVMITYLSTMQQFHSSMMGTQERMLMAYLMGEAEISAEMLESMTLPGKFAFIPNPALQSYEDCFLLQFCLSTVKHPFLLDHAIGGDVASSAQPSKVSLVPLMVALEIMAEGASLLYPHLRISKLSDVRAYRRIRTDSRDLNLNLELRAVRENCIEARICLPHVGEGESPVLASCFLEFSDQLPAAPAPAIYPAQESRDSKLSPHKLYGDGSMFHGPKMQSVERIDRVSKRSIEGRIACRHVDRWFADLPPEEAAKLVLDPLMLDNASQFVLYQMYEHEMPVTALLPFHIGSIEFYQGFHDLLGENVFASAHLRSMSLRGTEAQIQLVDPDGKVVVKVNDISSRAIVLPEGFRKFIFDPKSFVSELHQFPEVASSVIATLRKADLPDDETALDWSTDYILTEAEQSEWRQVGRTDKRRLDWLMGRMAAKDAVRALVEKEFGLSLKPADIEIRRAESGYAEALLTKFQLPWTPQISISHCPTIAAAIAEPPHSDRFSGIDVEEIIARDSGFEDLAFTEQERSWLAEKPVSECALHIAKLWTAKEAAAKACGSGLAGNPKLFELNTAKSTDSLFEIFANVQGIGRAGAYVCSVTSTRLAGTSLAIVIASREDDKR